MDSAAGTAPLLADAAGADSQPLTAKTARTYRLKLRQWSYDIDVDELRTWWRLVWTTGVGQMLRTSPAFIDIAFLGHLGTDALGASSLAQVWTQASSMWLMAGQEEVVATLVSQAHGHKNTHLTGVWLLMAWVVGAVACVPIALTWAFTGKILPGFGFGTGPQVSMAETFSRWYIMMLLPTTLFSALIAWCNAVGIVWGPLASCAASVAWSALLNYLLIWGTPQLHGGLGFIGSPISSGIVAVLSFGMLLGYVCWRHGFHRTMPSPSSLLRVSKARWYEFIVEQGIGNYIGAALEVMQLTIMSSLAAHLGEAPLATHNALLNGYMVITAVMFGGVRATSVRVGNALGAQRIDLAKQTMWSALVFLGAAAAVTALVLHLAARQVCLIFSSDEEIITLGTPLVSLLGVSLLLYSVMFAGIGVLLGSGRPGVVALCIMAGNWLVCVPLAFVFTKVLDLGLEGIWYALILGYGVATILSGIVMLRTDWDKVMAEAVARSKHETEEEAAEAAEAEAAASGTAVDTAPLVTGYGATSTVPSEATTSASALLMRGASDDDLVLGAPPRV